MTISYQENRETKYRNEYPFPTVSTQTPHSAHPSFSTTQSSPPPTASPFAFAPPPLSAPATTTFFRTPYAPQPNSDSQSIAAPAASPSFPNQTQQEQSAYSQGQRMMPPIAPPQHSAPIPSYPYSSVSMNYRSYSNDSTHGQKVSNSPAPGANLMRTPSLNLATPQSIPSQLSPALSSPYPYARQYQPTPNSVNAQYGMPSPQPRPNYPYMQAPEMPRSLTYPSYAQPYPSPQYAPQASMSTPSFHHSGVGLLRPSEASHSSPDIRPHIGYSFANRLPLVDRPFKCDECVQSFNRNHDLKRHKRIHLAVKPFGCDKCGKTFSRKDALRRHWLVKGCRGDEGATAPILPMFPVTGPGPRAPALSPPTPPNMSPPGSVSEDYSNPPSSNPMNYSRPSGPPPPLHTLPPRQHSDQSSIHSAVLVTPNDLGPQSLPRIERPNDIHLEEPIVIDSAMSHSGSGSSGGDPGQGSYFDGVMGIKGDGTALMAHSPYTRSFPSTSPSKAANMHHPYRRSPINQSLASPLKPLSTPTTSSTQLSPTTNGHHMPTPQTQFHAQSRHYSTSHPIGGDGKPMFAMPFAPENGYGHNQGQMMNGSEGQKMERVGSAESDPTTWARWHRPSFPFPAPPGVNVNYQYESNSSIDLTSGPTYSQ